MKIVVTGATGYIACRLEKWLINQSEKFEVNKITVGSLPTNFQLPKATEVIVHTAALVHKKESLYTEKDYFDVNCSLTIRLAEKAKASGVKHFIFLSTMAVYGADCLNDGTTEIQEDTPLNPVTMYGKSKLAAEKELMKMADDDFVVSIIRPPMVYGPNCPGNYMLLSKLAKKTPIFPSVQNERSMIYIDNLTEFLHQLIESRDGGIFHPQDPEYIRTSDMVNEIASIYGRKIIMNKLSGILLTSVFGRVNMVSKVFGDLTYAKELSIYRDNSYQRVCLKEAIKMSELIIED